MTSITTIADKWASNNEIDYNDCKNIKNLKNSRKIEIVKQIFIDDKKHFRSPSSYCNEIKTQDKKTFNKDIFKKLSNYIELNINKWIREAANTDLVDLVIKCVQAIVDINRLDSDPIFREEDVLDIYYCVWLIAGTNLRENLVKNDYLMNLLFFSIVPSYTKLFTLILRIISDLIINNAEKYYGPLIASMELTAKLLNSPSIFKWIIEILDFSRGMDFISAALDFLLSILNGTGIDSPQKFYYETIMIKDGIVEKLQRLTSFIGNQEGSNDSFSIVNNSITTFLNLLQLHQNVIFSLFEFDITKETECRVDIFNPLDSTSSFNFLSKCVNDSSLIQSFILSSIDINNHTTESYFKHLNIINYYTRIGLRKGYNFEEAFSKAVKMDIELKAEIPKDQNESQITVPSNITDLQMKDDFQNLYTHLFCDFKFTGFWDLPNEPPEMKYTETLEERREALLKAEKLRMLTIEQEEQLKKQESRRIFYEMKLKELLGEENYLIFLEQAQEQENLNLNNQENQNNNNNENQEIEEEEEDIDDKNQKIDNINVEQLAQLPPPPAPGSVVKVQPLNPPYKMDHVINIEKVDPGRIKDTVWNEIVPNQFDVDFMPLENYLKKDASQVPKKIIPKEEMLVIDSSFEKEVRIPFKSFKDRCPKIDETTLMNMIREKNPERELTIDNQNLINFLTKKEILKKQIEYLKKSILTVNEDEIMPNSFCIDLIHFIGTQNDSKKPKLDILREKIEKIQSDQDEIKKNQLTKELETESGMILETLLNIPLIYERLDFILLKDLYKQTMEEFIGPIEAAKAAFAQIRHSEKFKHFLEMSLKIINMMNSTFDRKNNRSGLRCFKLGFISQFTATEERRKNLEAFWLASENDESIKGFMDDLKLFEGAKSFEPNETYLQFQKLLKHYKKMELKFDIIKKNCETNDDDSSFLIAKWEEFVNEFGQNIEQIPVEYENDCKSMFDVMVYFDQCGSVTKNKSGLFRAGAKDFIGVMDEIYKAMVNSKRRIELHEAEAERKARILSRRQINS